MAHLCHGLLDHGQRKPDGNGVLYQKHTALEMIQKGYHDAILSMIRDDLGGSIPEYKSDNASAYIAEHLISQC